MFFITHIDNFFIIALALRGVGALLIFGVFFFLFQRLFPGHKQKRKPIAAFSVAWFSLGYITYPYIKMKWQMLPPITNR